MTKFEKSQENYKGYESFNQSVSKIIQSKTYELKVRDSKEYEDYDIEFVVTNSYSCLGDMIAFDVQITKLKGRYRVNYVNGVEFKKNGPNTFRRLSNSMKESFRNNFKSDVVIKSSLYTVPNVYLNNITV